MVNKRYCTLHVCISTVNYTLRYSTRSVARVYKIDGKNNSDFLQNVDW